MTSIPPDDQGERDSEVDRREDTMGHRLQQDIAAWSASRPGVNPDVDPLASVSAVSRPV
jgi:hypothetical protein